MGWPVERFIGQQLHRKFFCPKCNDIVRTPKMITDCKHVYCEECIPYANEVDYFDCCAETPVPGWLDEPSPEYMNQLNALRMRCVFEVKGCKFDRCTYGNHFEHEAACEYNTAGHSSSILPVVGVRAPAPSQISSEELSEEAEQELLCQKLEEEARISAEARGCTGVLGIHPRSRDVKIDNFSVTFYGSELLKDTKLELNCGRRYGLIGANGSGKSTLLSVVGNREVPIPDQIDIYHLTREAPASEKTALECVLEVDQEKARLEKLAEELAELEDDEAQEQLLDVYDRLDEICAGTAAARAGFILEGFGFTKDMQNKKCKDFNRGWRMRIALAKALYVKPHILLLDEPTNHLDLDAWVWLEEELKTYKRILVIISHSRDFLNGICTNILHLENRKLKYYGGNYDSFVQTRMEFLENQRINYDGKMDQVVVLKNLLSRTGYRSEELGRQLRDKQEMLSKWLAEGSLSVTADKRITFSFPSCGTIPPPVIMVQNVSFRYNPTTPYIYKNLEFGLDLDTRLALVGPNGAGKSTLLKLLYSELYPTEGMIRKNSHLRIARYHQHLHELLDLDLSPLDYMMKECSHVKERGEMRMVIGRYGLSEKQQVAAMRQLSDGQRCRVVFAFLATQAPHLLLLDEPTNHLDIETIDALADALVEFEGGVVLVSHDFRLISQVAKEIWVCEKEAVTKWEGNILKYKEHLKEKIVVQNNKNEKTMMTKSSKPTMASKVAAAGGAKKK